MESFFDIQLNVAGMADLHTAFAKYTESEVMDGENKYACEGHGLQVSMKGVSGGKGSEV